MKRLVGIFWVGAAMLLSQENYAQIYTSEVEVQADANGRVGIGNTNPDKSLTVGSGSGQHAIKLSGNWSGDNSALILENTNGSGSQTSNLHIDMNPAGGTTSTRHVRLSALEEGTSGGNYAFAVSLSKASSVSEVFRITSEGKVGIGTPNPSWRFQINGGNNSMLLVNGNGTPTSSRLAQISNGSGTEFVVLGDGNVGLGTISPTANLHIQKNANGWFQKFKGSVYSTGQYIGIKFHTGYMGEWNKWAGIAAVAENTHSNDTGLSFYADQTERVRIRANGNVGIGLTNPSQKLHVNGNVLANNVQVGSDRRLKMNIEPITSENFEKIISYQYQLRSDSSKHFGVIAQEIKELYPHMVHESNEGMLSVSYDEFIPLLIKKVQEQQEEIDDLRSRLEQMEQVIFKSAKK